MLFIRYYNNTVNGKYYIFLCNETTAARGHKTEIGLISLRKTFHENARKPIIFDIIIIYVPGGTGGTTLAGLQQQRRVAHRTVGTRHAFDARMRARLARRVVAESQVRVEAGRTLFDARARGLEHGRRTAGQTVFVGVIAASFTGPVTRLALCSGPELASYGDSQTETNNNC